jgi:hypothetical protein
MLRKGRSSFFNSNRPNELNGQRDRLRTGDSLRPTCRRLLHTSKKKATVGPVALKLYPA